MKSVFSLFFLVILYFLSLESKGQDASFSQFYAHPIYLNPALAGNTECGRLNLNYRNQWPSLSQAFLTYSVAYDQNLPSINSGYGLFIMRNDQGDGAYSRTQAAAIYAYKLQLSARSTLQFGMKAAFYQESIQWEKLIFPDMISSSTGLANLPTSELQPNKPTVYTADFAAGLSYGYDDKFFAGLSADHLFQPELSFYANSEERLRLRATLHAGLNINATNQTIGEVEKGDLLIQPNLLFLQQDEYSQLNMGVYFAKAPFVTGLWYKHSAQNADAVTALVGLQWDHLRVGYSYDYTVSQLAGRGGGAHEVSLGWDFCVYYEPKRKVRTIKSPVF
ncbi:MAG: PorP/SprF family type IX secretion system membrane protein [Bacteroidales bacterium]|nr:PorP/SprF family type IX secretion system membrane protein [Bacteroidales bacterium]